MTIFNEEAEHALDEYIEEATEARREEAIIFYEGCTIVTAPTGAPPEYITAAVDTINDPNVMWRGVPVMPIVGDEVIVWENPLSHRREIWGGSGTAGVSSGVSWCQVVVVAKCGGDFDDITDAIAWINALAAPPAGNLLYVLYVLAGNWIEGADVTIPPFVTLRGMGDGTSIEMGAFDLIMDDDSSLFDVKVTFAASGSLHIGSKDRVILEHVHGTQTSNDDVLYVYGTSSDVECKDCWFESTGNEALYVKDTADVRFDNCKFEAHAGSGYAFVLGDTATVRMEWCELTAYVPVFTVAGTTFDHFSCQFDLPTSTLAAGTHTALSTKRFNQTVIVAEEGGDFQLLSEATAWVAAQADHAAGKLYTILMLGGNFAEAANVTIPTFTHVVGMNDGTEIELADNTIIMSADSGLFNVKIESSDPSYAIDCNGVTGVWLRHVYVVTTAAGGCLYVRGASNVQAHDCVFEATDDTWSVYTTDSATLLLNHCIMEAGSGVGGYGLYMIGTSTVTAKWSEFEGYVPIYVGAVTTFNHIACQFDPNFTPAAVQWFPGRHHALPTKRFNQVVIVAEEGGDFQALSEAVKWINNQGDAAAGKLYGVLMLHGNFAEALSVTIPSYVHVVGMGEGTEIEFAANRQLILSSYSSLMDVVVESSPGATWAVIYASNVVDVLLRNVRSINGSAVGYCYGFANASVVECYHCIAETSAANAIGFYISGTADIFLKDCSADDETNFVTALFFTDTACSAETHDCTFRGNTLDVSLAAAAAWEHIGCHFDPDNSTLAGTETPLVTGKANYDDVVTFENGVTFDGLTTQNIITIPDNFADAVHIVDVGGLEYMRIVSTDVQPIVYFNQGEADINFRISAAGGISDPTDAFFLQGSTGFVFIGDDAPTFPGHLAVADEALNTDASFQGFVSHHVKTAGASDNADAQWGGYFIYEMNQAAGTIGTLYGVRSDVIITDGNVGSGAGDKSIRAFYLRVALDGGKVWGPAWGNRVIIDQAGANEVTGSIYGTEIDVDADGTVGGSVFLLYLRARSNVDYGIYQDGVAVNHLAGATSVGGTVAPLAQVHVDQSAVGGAIPVLLLDQADLSEEFIEFTTTVGAGNPIDTAGSGAYYGKARVMVTGVGYKNLRLYEES